VDPVGTETWSSDDPFEDLFDNAPCGFLSTDADGTLTRVNATLAAWTGRTSEELVGHRRFVDLLSPGGRIYHETHYAPLLRMQGAVSEIAFELLAADGTRRPVLVSARTRSGPDGTPAGTITSVFDMTDRRQYEQELLRARRRAEQYAGRLALLEQVVADLAGVPALDQVRAVVTGAGATAFGADLGVLQLREDEGSRASLWPRDADIRGGQVVVTSGPEATGRFPRLVDLLDAGDAGTVVVVPLSVRGQTTGVLAARFDAGRTFDRDELALLRTLGRQAGLAVERAQLFEQQRDVSTTLQRSLLPHVMPEDARYRLATLYRPAVDALEVGGDWYDAFALDRHRLVVVVGDVVGRGLHAAAAMGQLRSAIRALAAVDPDPSTVLWHLDRFVDAVPAARTATLVYGVVDLVAGVLRYACAGHPPPVLLDERGARLLWAGRSAPLGARFGPVVRAQAEERLNPGSRLLLYTDGLVERRDRPLDERIDTLAAEVGAAAGIPLDALLDPLVDAMLSGVRTRDDVCALCFAHAEQPMFTWRVDQAAGSPLSDMRHRLAEWLDAQTVPRQDRDGAVLAVSEAVANSVEHGYPDGRPTFVQVEASVDHGVLRLRIEDQGTWKPTPSGRHRGRGLHLIRRLMDDVTVDAGAGPVTSGTVVTMRRRLSAAEGR
jgi:serine/threonine-protein kinase RsbW